jgi:hypothetical protein
MNRTQFLTFAAATTLVVTFGVVLAARVGLSQPPDELEAAIAARQDAMDNGAVDAWERYTTDDFVSINTDGRVGHKSAGPERDRVLTNRSGSTSRRPTRVIESLRRYGQNVAIQITLVTPPVDGARPNRVTGVWVRNSGAWKVASSQGSVIQN